MAGGSGDKLWPRSTELSPKHFRHFIGDGSLIKNTYNRLVKIFDKEDIYIVTKKELKYNVMQELEDFPDENIILEPFGLNTAPCLCLASTILHKEYTEDTVLYAFPSDHIIGNFEEFVESLALAGNVAYSRKGIVTLGVTPTRPETNYGYVQIDDDKDDLNGYYDLGVRYSKTFAEKPDISTAKRFIESNDFLWNSGIFVWRLDTFWNSIKKFLPDHYKLFDIIKKNVGQKYFYQIADEIYQQIEAASVDYAILEKADNVYVVKSTFSWSDLGNWDELYRLLMKDARNNFIEGNVVALETTNCFVSSRDKMIGIVGVENLIVIEDEKSIIICERGKSEKVKDIVDYLKRKHINNYL